MVLGSGAKALHYTHSTVQTTDYTVQTLTAGQLKLLQRSTLVSKITCKQNLDLRCVLISDPSTLGAGAKTRFHTPKAVTYHEQPDYCRFMIGHSLGRMDSRIKKFTPHCMCRPSTHRMPHIMQNFATAGRSWNSQLGHATTT